MQHAETHDALEFRLVGRTIAPGLLRSKELADIIEAIEDMVASVAVRDNPGLQKESIVVGLTSIEPGSVRLRFASPDQVQVTDAFEAVARAVQGAQFETLPSSSVRALQRVSRFTRRHDCRAEFWTLGGNHPAAVVTPNTEVSEPELIKGNTSLYGSVIRVGGREPRVMFETLSGKTVYCDASEEVAKKLAHRLYGRVQLDGRATWDPDGWTLEEFEIQSASELHLEPRTRIMQELSDAVGEFYEDIEDPVEYVAAVRSGGET